MMDMSRLGPVAALVATLMIAATTPSQAQMHIVDGQAYWGGDPGPVTPGPFYAGGQNAADPDHYLSWYGQDPQDYRMTVRAHHAGPGGCVWRRRVIVTDWDFRHPYLQVCD